MTRYTHSKLLLTLLAVGGCSQLIGLSDYDIDPSLDQSGGAGGSGAGGKASGGSAIGTPGGDTSVAGQGGQSEPSAGAGGAGGEPAGGAGGTPPEAGAGGEPLGGAGGSGGGGVLVPCETALCCTQAGGVPVGEELLADGGFELGTVAEGNTPWTELSTNEIAAITDDTSFGWSPRAGLYFAYLSGLQDETTNIWSEDVLIPADAGWLELTGYRLFQIDAQDAINADYAVVGFYGYGEAPFEEPFYWTAPTASGSLGWGDVSVWTRFTASWSAAPHQGEIRYLGFEGSSDAYPTEVETDSSSYLFDSISLQVFRCYK